ncbi:MAG: murein transglycosylase A [Gammaproteobacteria bacterium]|nr:murein transglycosylase A [Gammaproteobacteria bacterium]
MPTAISSILRFRRVIALTLLSLSLASCFHVPPPPGPGPVVAWSELPGWSQATLAPAWPALLQSCLKLPQRDPSWQRLCQDAALLPAPSESAARVFFETHFAAHVQYGAAGETEGLITGYYEPLLNGSRTRSERFRYPLYRAPDDLLTLDLGELYPELRNQRLRGRLVGRRVVPYFSRAEIDNGSAPLAGNELLWVDDPVALFFLQIQGSGRVLLPTGETLHVGYADQNGHPYKAIGRTLIERAGLTPEQVNAPSIRAWLAANPAQAQAVLQSNPSYVFFTVRETDQLGPIGALGVPLLAERAIAVDPAYVPLGAPVWLDTTLADTAIPYRQLVFAQDTGGAIRGPVRADLFFGHGATAEDGAGRMRQPGRLSVLLPATSPGS